MVKIKCPKCKYIWDYKGKSKYYCSCPRCRRNIKVPSAKVKKRKR